MPTPIKKPTISDIFKFTSTPVVQPGFSLKTMTLPNGGGSYQAPGMPQSTIAYPQGAKPNFASVAPAAPAPTLPILQKNAPVTAPAPSGQNPSLSPLFGGSSSGPTGATAPAPQIPQQWMKPGGGLYTPEEIAANIAASAPKTAATGDVGKLAADEFGNKNPTAAELQTKATLLNNTRNDIAVGANDPYKVASESGIAYTPQELDAIESAYAGVYKPALTTALSKLSEKQAADKSKADAEAQANQPFTLGKDQVRYDAKGNPIAVGISDTAAPGGVYTPGANPVVDAYVKGFQSGTYKASDIPDEYKDMVAQGINQATGSGNLSKTSLDALGIINQLQTDPGIDKLSGTGIIGSIEHPSSLFPGTEVQNAQNLAKQLQATLSLANRQQLKGQGAISDFEFKVLGDASTALGLDGNGRTNLSADQFKKALQNLELKLSVGPLTKLTDDEVQYLNSQNYTPDQIRQYDASQSFSDVGNTKASGNRPQRNNNPGNVKGGGLADSLAVGKDDQGHLVFPDAQTGFKALTADLTAKINGGSSHLPANPTIEQLGKVYAADPNWAVRVAKIVGVPVSTHTQNVPIANLVKAVATQEGFYA